MCGYELDHLHGVFASVNFDPQLAAVSWKWLGMSIFSHAFMIYLQKNPSMVVLRQICWAISFAIGLKLRDNFHQQCSHTLYCTGWWYMNLISLLVMFFPSLQKGLLAPDQCIQETLHTRIHLGFFQGGESIIYHFYEAKVFFFESKLENSRDEEKEITMPGSVLHTRRQLTGLKISFL